MTPGTTLPALTGLRAYAAVWVMLLHLQYSLGVRPHVDLGAFVAHGFWAVDIFFVLSGFILCLTYAGRLEARWPVYVDYLLARFARIYPLHLLTLLLLGAVYFGGHLLGHFQPLPAGFRPDQFLANLGLLHAWSTVDRLNWNYPSWSISAEWFAYLLLLPAAVWLLRRSASWALVALALGAWFALAFALLRQGQAIGEQHVSWALPRITAGFLLGCATFRLARHYPLTPRVADAMLLASIGLIVVAAYAAAELEVLIGPASMALVWALANPGRWGRRVFADRGAVYWGERSYAIYMLHAPVQILINLLLLRAGLVDLSRAAGWLLFGGQVLLVLGLSAWVYYAVEAPARRAIRRLSPLAPDGGTR